MDQVTEVVVSGLALDAKNNSPVVILQEKDGDRMLPIWIGVFEANAIAMQLVNVALKRPQTYDLVGNILAGLDAQIIRVLIYDDENQAYFASLQLKYAGGIIEVDARPSDSIVLALKAGAPLVVTKKIIASSKNNNSDAHKFNSEDLRSRLENIDLEKIGDFKL